ncbi:MAG TPA: cobalamin-dependent protein [Candidatus Hydrogenedentes bacterium]|nr:cobalamin-dependent protein [Candidatus Hydrogenedentota bacterium]
MSTLLLSVQRDLDVIGPRGLHQFLLSRGEESILLFLPVLERDTEATLAALDRFVAKTRPALAGLSLMSFEYARAVRVTRMLRERHPGMPVVWGGIHPTCDPESSLEAAEWICIGEGEQTLLDLACAAREGRSFRDIPNIGWREGGTGTSSTTSWRPPRICPVF